MHTPHWPHAHYILFNIYTKANFIYTNSDKQGEFYNCREVLEELCLGLISDQDCQDIRYVCEVVSKRAAQLAAVGVACLLNKVFLCANFYTSIHEHQPGYAVCNVYL